MVNLSIESGLEIRGILVANATMFSHLLGPRYRDSYCHKFMVLFKCIFV